MQFRLSRCRSPGTRRIWWLCSNRKATWPAPGIDPTRLMRPSTSHPLISRVQQIDRLVNRRRCIGLAHTAPGDGSGDRDDHARVWPCHPGQFRRHRHRVFDVPEHVFQKGAVERVRAEGQGGSVACNGPSVVALEALRSRSMLSTHCGGKATAVNPGPAFRIRPGGRRRGESSTNSRWPRRAVDRRITPAVGGPISMIPRAVPFGERGPPDPPIQAPTTLACHGWRRIRPHAELRRVSGSAIEVARQRTLVPSPRPTLRCVGTSRRRPSKRASARDDREVAKDRPAFAARQCIETPEVAGPADPGWCAPAAAVPGHPVGFAYADPRRLYGYAGRHRQGRSDGLRHASSSAQSDRQRCWHQRAQPGVDLAGGLHPGTFGHPASKSGLFPVDLPAGTQCLGPGQLGATAGSHRGHPQQGAAHRRHRHRVDGAGLGHDRTAALGGGASA